MENDIATSVGHELRLGQTTVTRVVEWLGALAPVADVFPDTPARLWQENRSWLAPDFYEPTTRSYRVAIQTWVVRSAGSTVLIDTGGVMTATARRFPASAICGPASSAVSSLPA